jgi:hypothetical protein
MHTVPVICKIQSTTTPAQANSGANRAITDDLLLLHHSRQLDQPFPVGSIDADNKIYCTAIGELHLLTAEGYTEQFPCFYCAQSAGTVISPDHKCTTLGHITKWEQEGDTRTGKGAIRFRNSSHEVVATLHTYRQNGLWYTELSAIPADSHDPVSIHTLYATDPATQSLAFTDSDRHHWTADDINAIAIHSADHPSVKLVTTVNESNEHDNDLEAVKEAFDKVDPPTEPPPPAPTPYPDPHLPPPDEPPPVPKKTVSFQKIRSQDPTAPHIEDTHYSPSPTKSYQKPKRDCRSWEGVTPPVPKQPPGNQKPSPSSQLTTELWHHCMGHPGTQKLRKTQQHTTGMPTLGQLHPLFDCNNCNMAKMTKQSRGKDDIRSAHHNGERFHMDYGFF